VGQRDRTQWPVRDVPAALRDRYLAQGWWTDETLASRVDARLADVPDAGFHIWSDTRPWHGTYADVQADARRLVTFLTDAGIEPGDVVAFQLPNWREAVVAFYGLAMGGYVLAPIVHIYGPKEVRFILEQSGARAYISADRFGHVDYLDIVDGAEPGELGALDLQIVVGETRAPVRDGVRRVAWSEVESCVPAPAIATPDPDDVCVLAYTSGTTSDPKGVLHNHRTLLAEMLHMRSFEAGRPILMGSPVTHATGMLGALLGPLNRGEDIHLIDRWDPGRVLEVMLEADVTGGTGASVFLASIIDHPDFTAEHAKRMPRVGLGGAPVPVALGERAQALGISIVRAYGSTEHPSVTGSVFEDPAEKRHRTDGSPKLGVEVRLLDEDGAPVPAGTAGEIWSRGPDLSLGYTDPALTADAFDADGWYRSGDMGVLEVDGFLTITDRVKDVIIRGGENISAAELEEVVVKLPAVAEVAVVAAPDARLGEHACAVVRLAPGASLTLNEITDALAAAGLARQKWPEELRVVDDFPRTGSGKIRKVDLRRHLLDAGGSPESASGSATGWS
jgi:acyl-CoA synthetase (AMP-forming)/AMP-acid ligase II